MFTTIDEFHRALCDSPAADAEARASAEARNARLTKPAGALGRLEDLAIWYAGWRPVGPASPERVQIALFAGNHGVTAQGVSAFPADVTAQMVANFKAGGAAINQLARVAGAALTVHPLDLARPTGDITQAPAMDEADLLTALQAGWQAVTPDADLLVVGEMGIGNTTVAAALAAGFYGGGAARWVGRGTGVDAAGLARKRDAVDRALARHAAVLDGGDPLQMLAALGGREVAAMTGALARARVAGLPVMLDGFIATAAAAVLARVLPGDGLDHVIAGHCSDEAAHGDLLQHLGLTPLLRLGLRLGEGSGAALAVPILRAALACHAGMATFDEAGVSDDSETPG